MTVVLQTGAPSSDSAARPGKVQLISIFRNSNTPSVGADYLTVMVPSLFWLVALVLFIHKVEGPFT
jgi:hypothetical protein